jgi:hypothetical protein
MMASTNKGIASPNVALSFQRRLVFGWALAVCRPHPRFQKTQLDNGPPGFRRSTCYSAFVIDPDGNNIEAIWQTERHFAV